MNKTENSKRQALRPIIKTTATTLRSRTGQPLRRECWSAVTVDGLWGFERIEDVGTPWIVVANPRTSESRTILDGNVEHWFGTLKAARTAVEKGQIS